MKKRQKRRTNEEIQEVLRNALFSDIKIFKVSYIENNYNISIRSFKNQMPKLLHEIFKKYLFVKTIENKQKEQSK